MSNKLLLSVASIFLALFILGAAPHLTLSNESENSEAPEEVIPPLGLPPIPWPADNPYTKEKWELGRFLYFDKRLSSDGTVSCASCHHVGCGYGDCRPIAVGIDGEKGTRHSPTIINTAYDTVLFWDGRATSLEEQCKGPLASPKEMTKLKDPHEAHRECVESVSKIAGYKPLFKKAFGSEEITLERLTQAVATFERSVLSGNSPFDRYMAGERTALTKEQVHGMAIFRKVDCPRCHQGFNFASNRFQNIGIGMDQPDPDLGRYVITHDEKDWGAFKTPTLREVEHTAPYMHDGSLKTLEEVVDYYDKGGIPNKNLHEAMKPLHLTDEEKRDLVSFLKALSGEGWQQIEEPKVFPSEKE